MPLRSPRVISLSESTRRLVWFLPSGFLAERFIQLLKEEVSYSRISAFASDDEQGDIVILEYPENQSNAVVFVVYLMNQLYRSQQLVRQCWDR